MPRNNYLSSAFHLVCFHGPDKYFVKFYICFSSCVRVLNMKRCFNGNYTFSVINFFTQMLQVASKQDKFLN